MHFLLRIYGNYVKVVATFRWTPVDCHLKWVLQIIIYYLIQIITK